MHIRIQQSRKVIETKRERIEEELLSQRSMLAMGMLSNTVFGAQKSPDQPYVVENKAYLHKFDANVFLDPIPSQGLTKETGQNGAR
jgi:hypothetical protein